MNLYLNREEVVSTPHSYSGFQAYFVYDFVALESWNVHSEPALIKLGGEREILMAWENVNPSLEEVYDTCMKIPFL